LWTSCEYQTQEKHGNDAAMLVAVLLVSHPFITNHRTGLLSSINNLCSVFTLNSSAYKNFHFVIHTCWHSIILHSSLKHGHAKSTYSITTH